MGFYDVSCALSSISLMGLPRSVVVVLAQVDGRWEAASPPIRGIYNRLGTLDIRRAPAADVSHWAQEMLAARAAGRLVVAPEYWEMAEESAADHYPPNAAEAADVTIMLHLFDRFVVHASIEGFPTEPIRLDGRVLGHNFVSEPVFDAIANQHSDREPAAAAVAWAREHGRPIVPITMADIHQHTLGRIKKDLATARERFAGVPWLLPAIKDLTIEHAKG